MCSYPGHWLPTRYEVDILHPPFSLPYSTFIDSSSSFHHRNRFRLFSLFFVFLLSLFFFCCLVKFSSADPSAMSVTTAETSVYRPHASPRLSPTEERGRGRLLSRRRRQTQEEDFTFQAVSSSLQVEAIDRPIYLVSVVCLDLLSGCLIISWKLRARQRDCERWRRRKTVEKRLEWKRHDGESERERKI